MEKLKIPVYGINPFLGVVNLEWFLTLLPKIEKKNLNLFLVHNIKGKDLKKNKGAFINMLVKKQMASVLLKNKNVGMIGSFDTNTFVVLSENNIVEELQNSLNEIEDVRSLIVGTAINEKENTLFAMSRLNTGFEVLASEYNKDNSITAKIV